MEKCEYIKKMYDKIDAKILGLLQEDGRLSNAALAEAVGLTTSTVFERVKKLERKGLITGYVALVSPPAVKTPLTAFIHLIVGYVPGEDYAAGKQKFVTRCIAEPAVLECHSVAGEDCYLIKVRVTSTTALEALLERLRAHTYVQKSTSSIVMSTFKETAKIPIPVD